MEAKQVPDNIKEDVRAVLLSKTDGTGILVSKFLSDYKSFVHNMLKYKEMGFSGLQAFLEAIPDVCRLEYSQKDMAYRIFGISKPNVFVSSFVQKAQGRGARHDSPKHRQNDKVDKYTPSSNINKEWEPNARGLITLCILIQKGLETKEEITEHFKQAGEVVEVNVQSRLAFVRYSDVKAAKKAVELWGESLGVCRAVERSNNPTNSTVATPTNFSDNKDRWNTSSSINNSISNSVDGKYIPRVDNIRNIRKYESTNKTERMNVVSKSATEFSSENPGSRVLRENSQINDPAGRSIQVAGMSSPNPGQETKCDRWNTTQKVLKQTSATAPEQMLQVYVGNWPSNVDESELKKLIMCYDHCGCRILTAKNSDTKKFAFVDLKCVEEANRMIEQLDGLSFQGRTLHVRYGNNNNVKDTEGQLTIHSKYVNKDFSSQPSGSSPNKMLTPKKIVLSGRPQQDDSADEMPPLERALCSSVSKLDNSDEMPPLENIVSSKMPKLEGIVSQNMAKIVSPKTPKLENFPDEMPPLESLVLTKPENHWEKHCSSHHPTEQNYHRNGYVDINDDEEVDEEENGIQENKVHAIQLNIANFPCGTSEADLADLLSPYGVKSIVMMNNRVANRSTYAFALFSNTAQAQNAMLSLDQNFYKGKKLCVTFTTPVAQTVAIPFSQLGDLRVSVADEPECQFSPIQSGNMGQHRYDRPGSDHLSRLGRMRLTNTFKVYLKIVTKLHGESDFDFPVGSTLKVLITHVEEDKFFWGQVLSSSVHAMLLNMSIFQEVSMALQCDECRTHTVTDLGRCTALFCGMWYRGWCIQIVEKDSEVYGNVLFIDYGNTELMPLKQIFHTNGNIELWHIPCMAKPFKLTEPKHNLIKMTNAVVMLKVIETGVYKNNFLTTVSFQENVL